MSAAPCPIPRLPVFGWASLRGRRDSGTATLLDLPGMHYSTSGRASILLALEAMRIGTGDRMLLPTYHCPTMAAPAAARGVALTFYPIDACGAPDMAWLDAQDLSGVRAILVAHYFGLPQPMAAMRRWCDDKGIALIEDCAHALFGRSGERSIGAWGDMAIGSLTKFLPVPEGGCLVINNGAAPPALEVCSERTQLKVAIDILEEGARHCRLAGLNAVVSRPLRALRGLRANQAREAPPATAGTRDDTEDGSRIDLALAHRALARPSRWVAQCLPRERIVQRRRQRYAELASRLAGRSGLRPLMPTTLPPDCAPYMFPLWVDDPDPGYAELRRLNMPVFRWDRLWQRAPTLQGDCGIEWSHHVIQLACHQDLSDADVDQLVKTLLEIFAVPALAVGITQQPVAAARAG